MGIEQTNFLHIFDETEAAKDISPEEIIDNKEVETSKEDEPSKKSEHLISESLISKEEEIKKEAERKLKRLRLLQMRGEIPLSEFDDIMPEIKAYEIRLSMLRAIYEKATPGEDKQKAYAKLVDPNIYDDEPYRDSARLYLKYLESLKIDLKRRAVSNNSKAKGKKKERSSDSLESIMKKIKDYKPGYKDASARNFE